MFPSRRKPKQIDDGLARVMASQIKLGLASPQSHAETALTAIGIMLLNATDDAATRVIMDQNIELVPAPGGGTLLRLMP